MTKPKHYSLLERLFNGDEINRHLAELEGELRVRTEIMNVTSIVSESDKKGDILSINDKYMEVSKYSKSELIGHPHSITRHPDTVSYTHLDVYKRQLLHWGRCADRVRPVCQQAQPEPRPGPKPAHAKRPRGVAEKFQTLLTDLSESTP